MTAFPLSPARNLAPDQEFNQMAPEEQVLRTARSLEENGFQVFLAETADQARDYVLNRIPSGAVVYNPPSRTLEQIGLAVDIETSTRFKLLRARINSMDRIKQRGEIRQLISSPDVIVSSVHAITEKGEVLIASASGSQLGPEVFGAGTVIWVVGTQKLVPTLDDGFRRIREYCYPLEDDRARQVYGQPSAIRKILVVNAELPGRITIVLVKQILGF